MEVSFLCSVLLTIRSLLLIIRSLLLTIRSLLLTIRSLLLTIRSLLLTIRSLLLTIRSFRHCIICPTITPMLFYEKRFVFDLCIPLFHEKHVSEILFNVELSIRRQ